MKESNLNAIPLMNIEFNIKKVKEMHYFKWQSYLCLLDIGEQIRENDSQSVGHESLSMDKMAEFEKVIENYKARDGQLLLDYLDLDSLNFGHSKIENIRFAKLKSNRLRNIKPLMEFDSLE